MTRTIVHRTRGYGHGPIVRLMSPSDLRDHLKPFVFLDLSGDSIIESMINETRCGGDGLEERRRTGS